MYEKTEINSGNLSHSRQDCHVSVASEINHSSLVDTEERNVLNDYTNIVRMTTWSANSQNASVQRSHDQDHNTAVRPIWTLQARTKKITTQK